MISVIIPTYNGLVKGLERSIKSVLMLKKVEEVIIGIDGSNDKSYELCNKLKKKEKRIKYFQNKKNIGWGKTTALCMSMVKCDWTIVHCDDDWMLPEMNNLIEFSLGNNLDLAYSKYAVGNDKTKKIGIFNNPTWEKKNYVGEKDEFHDLLLHDCYIGRCIIKTQIYKKTFNFKALENLKNEFGEEFTAIDYSLFLEQSSKDAKFGYLNQITNVWTQRAGQETGMFYNTSGKHLGESSYLFNKYYDEKKHRKDWEFLGNVFNRVKFLYNYAKSKNKIINPIYESHFKVFSKKISSLRGSNV